MRIFYLEDNPLIVFHVEHLIEDLGHTFAGALDSFAALKSSFADLSMDVALIDIDLADGRTGPDAARWLADRSVKCLFLTGQDKIAEEAGNAVIGIVSKPVTLPDLAAKLALVDI
jgi:CheY-like chemotaxis protein